MNSLNRMNPVDDNNKLTTVNLTSSQFVSSSH